MSRLVLNRDGGSADQYGHLLALSRSFVGEVIEGLVVTANSTPNMSVRVPAGSARIPTGAAPSNYHFFVSIDTASPGESVTIATADAANPRNDIIVAYVDLALTPSLSPANNPGMLKLLSVSGTPAATPSDPSASAIQAAVGAGNPYIKLARVSVGAAVTQISAGNLTDLRTLMTNAANTVGTDSLQAGSVNNSKLASTAGELGGEWKPFTTAFTASGSMTISASSYTAYYIQIGKTVYFQLEASGSITLGGTASNSIFFTLPVPPRLRGTGFLAAGFATVTPDNVSGWSQLNNSGSQAIIRRYDQAIYALGSGKTLRLFGMYEAA